MSEAEEILVRSELRAAFHSETKVRDRLQKALRRNGLVEEAYLFGSYASGQAGRHSDIDLIVVARTQRPFLERHKDFGALFEIESDLDLLVYTPAEIARLKKPPLQGFWKSVWQTAVRLM